MHSTRTAKNANIWKSWSFQVRFSNLVTDKTFFSNTWSSDSGLFFEKHLKYIKLSEGVVPFSKRDLTYLLKDNYDATFLKEVYQTPVVTFEELRRGIVNSKGPVRIQYNNRNQYKTAAKSLGIMDDFKV